MIDRCGCTSACSAVSSPVCDQLLDEAVVGGDLAQLAVAQEVRARVADVADEQRAAGDQRARGERGAHAAQARRR